MSAATRLAAAATSALLFAAVSACGSGSSSTSPNASTSSTAPRATTSTQPSVLDCDLPPAGTRQIEIAGTARVYDVYTPTSVSTPPPLLLLFHGFTSTSGEIARTTGLANAAPERGVVLVAPQGAGEPTDWNVIAGFDEDAAFIDAVIEQLRGYSCLQGTDLWLAGFSAGSAFSGVYGCSRAGTVTGLGLFSGLPPAICPERETPQVIIAHGTDDPAVPFAGGDQPVGDTTIHLAPVSESAAAWAERAGCAREPTARAIADDLTVTTWGGCARTDATVSLQVTHGGGHTWPMTESVSASCVLIDAVTRPGGDPFAHCPAEGSG